MPYRFLDHTADVGAEVTAPDLGALFAEAAAAFTDTVTVLGAVRPREEHRLEVAAGGLEELLIEWLGELNFRFETEGLLVAEAAVAVTRGVGEAGTAKLGWHLAATVRGEPYDPERHPIRVLVKAITYHQLAVRRQPDGGWLARVIFDV